MAFPWAALVAGATGVLSGMSIGGGSLLVPALVLLLGVPQRVAQGVVLATFPPVALVAAWIHWRQGFLRWRLALRVTAGSALGAWLGAQLGTIAPDDLLRRLFGVYLVAVGVYALYRSRQEPPPARGHGGPRKRPVGRRVPPGGTVPRPAHGLALGSAAQEGQELEQYGSEARRRERAHGDALEESDADQRPEDQADDHVGVLLQQDDAPGAQDGGDEARHQTGIPRRPPAGEGLDGLLQGDLPVGERDQHRHNEQDQPQGHGVLLQGGEQRSQPEEAQEEEDPYRRRDQRVAAQGAKAEDG